MKLNPPPKVRTALYIFTGVGSLVVTYLCVKELIGVAEVALWTGFTTFIAGMAGFNVPKPE